MLTKENFASHFFDVEKKNNKNISVSEIHEAHFCRPADEAQAKSHTYPTTTLQQSCKHESICLSLYLSCQGGREPFSRLRVDKIASLYLSCGSTSRQPQLSFKT